VGAGEVAAEGYVRGVSSFCGEIDAALAGSRLQKLKVSVGRGR
jgi:hypothetical protein